MQNRLYTGGPSGWIDGYNSWAEKENALRYWTRIERHRRVYDTAQKVAHVLDDKGLQAALGPLLKAIYLKRMRALSTTNFGMATPYLAPGRESAVNQLLDEMDADLRKIESLVRKLAGRHCQAAVHGAGAPKGYRWRDAILLVSEDRTAESNSRGFFSLMVDDAVPADHRFFLDGVQELEAGSLVPCILHQDRIEQAELELLI